MGPGKNSFPWPMRQLLLLLLLVLSQSPISPLTSHEYPVLYNVGVFLSFHFFLYTKCLYILKNWIFSRSKSTEEDPNTLRTCLDQPKLYFFLNLIK
jgi:hypothetical protein